MALVAVDAVAVPARRERIQDLVSNEEHWRTWLEHPCSSILHHDADCCEEARLWFLSYARSMEISALCQFEVKAPTWLSQLFTWGPSDWPISWCTLVKEEVLDCGVFAALAREVFTAQGHSVHPAQALLSYNATCTEHWRKLWQGGPKLSFPWIGKEIVYHEICVLEQPDGTARFYDSTWGSWYEAQPRLGFGSLLALRSECPRLLRWGNQTFKCGEWVEL